MAGLFRRATNKLKNSHERYTAVIIMGGICNITEKDMNTGEVHLRNLDAETTAKGKRKDIKKGLKKIKSVSPQIPVIITPTIGIDLVAYNNVPVAPLEQDTLNEIVLEIN